MSTPNAISTNLAFINHQFIPQNEAVISMNDRGFQLSDGVYEVVLLNEGKFIDLKQHLERLFNSLDKMQIEITESMDDLLAAIKLLQEKNQAITDALYIQITRGVSPRTQTFAVDCKPTIIMYFMGFNKLSREEVLGGFNAVTTEDIRWKKCDIKSISLLGNMFCKNEAIKNNATEAILLEDAYITEGSFSSAFMVDSQNNLITRPTSDGRILKGITRDRIIDLAKKNGITLQERKFTPAELFAAKEAFVSSSTLMIRPIVKIDDKVIGDGKVGDITKKLISLYDDFIS